MAARQSPAPKNPSPLCLQSVHLAWRQQCLILILEMGREWVCSHLQEGGSSSGALDRLNDGLGLWSLPPHPTPQPPRCVLRDRDTDRGDHTWERGVRQMEGVLTDPPHDRGEDLQVLGLLSIEECKGAQ